VEAFASDEIASADDLVAQLAAGGALTFEPDAEEELLPESPIVESETA
jgi:hypothetical protein